MRGARNGTRRRVSRCALVSRRFLTLLLALSLWHAPVPWFHAHDLLGPDVDHIAQLHRHVDAFHASEIAAGESHLELHAHLILPWERDADPDDPGSPHVPGSDDFDVALLTVDTASTLSAKVVGRALDLLTSSVSQREFALADDGLVWEASLRASSHGTHFFETYGSSVSIGDLVSVRLC